MTHRNGIGFIPSIAVGIWLFSLGSAAQAQEETRTTEGGAGAAADRDQLSFSVGAGSFYSDNVGRTPTDEESDGAANVGLRFAYRRDKRRFDALIDSDLEYREYFKSTYGSDLVGGLTGTLNYWLLPDRLAWAVEENFGQTYTRLTDVETPDNRQNVNYFSTGPNVFLPITDRTELRGQARWAKSSYGETETTSSHRFTGTLGLVRRLSEHSLVSLNGSGEKVEYDNLPDGSDFTQRSAFLGYEAEGARTTLTAQGGWTTFTAPNGDHGGLLANASVSRKIGARSTLALTLGTGMTDAAEAFRRDQTLGGVVKGNEAVTNSPDPFRSDYATLVWNLSGVRNRFAATTEWRRDVGQGNTTVQERAEVGSHVELSRRLTPALTGSVEGVYRRDKFADSGFHFDEWSIGPVLNWAFARSLAVTLRYDYFRGSGHAVGQGDVRDYTENRVSVAFSFGSGN